MSAGLASCRDPQPVAYRIPKEPEHDHAAHAAAAAAPMTDNTGGLVVAAPAAGELSWTAPAAWTAVPGSAMRKGSYRIGAEGGPTADLAITAFPGDVGGDLANVNRWRGQISLPPITAAELPAALTPVSAHGLAIRVVDVAGGAADTPLRILGAIVPHGGATWFFKLTGPDALVAGEKARFLEFLQTVKIASEPAPAAPVAASTAPAAMPPPDMSGPPVVSAGGPGLKWSAPAHWQEKPAAGTRKGTFLIPNAAGPAAELAITAFPGDVGGELANLNRWRGQLSLPPVAAADLPGAVQKFNAHGLAVTLADLTGGTPDNPQRLLGAMVPHGGSTWFFKLSGPPALLAAEKPAFIAFLQSLATP